MSVSFYIFCSVFLIMFDTFPYKYLKKNWICHFCFEFALLKNKYKKRKIWWLLNSSNFLCFRISRVELAEDYCMLYLKDIKITIFFLLPKSELMKSCWNLFSQRMTSAVMVCLWSVLSWRVVPTPSGLCLSMWPTLRQYLWSCVTGVDGRRTC